jgi:putative transposase
MAGLLLSYVHYYHGRYGFVGHLWQGRFKSPAIQWDNYLLSCGRYIERNPVAAGLTDQPWAYPWSSCRAYALGTLDPLLSVSPLYLELAGEEPRRQQLWREFLLGEDPREEEVRRGDWVVGDADCRQHYHTVRGRATPEPRRGRPRRRPTPQEGPFLFQ